MADTYLEKVGEYYNEKIKFQTKKKKFLSCSNCPKSKEFKETNTELVFTCGSNKGKCGVQIKIQLPEYTHYPSEIRKLQESLNSHINWDELVDYIDLDKKMKDEIKKHKEIKDTIFKLTNQFYEDNFKKNQASLQRFYNNRIEKTKRCRIIKKQLDTQELSPLEKQSLHKEYVSHVNEMNQGYKDTKKLIEQLNPYSLRKEPKITIENYQFKNEMKSKKTPTKDIDPNVIQSIMDHFKDKEGVLTKTDYNRLFRKQTKITWGKNLFPLLQQGDDSWLSDKQEEIGSVIKVPKEKIPSQIELTKEWKQHLSIKETKKQTENAQDTQNKDKQELIQRMIDYFKQNNGIMSKTDYNKQVKKPSKLLWGKKLFTGLQKNNKDSWLNETQKQIGSIIILPNESKPSEIRLTNEWLTYLEINNTNQEEDTQDDEPEPEPENPETTITMEDVKKAYNLGVNKRKQTKDNTIQIKIKWKLQDSDEIEEAYLDLDSKFNSKQVNIINKMNQKMKINVSDLIEIITE